MGEGISKDLRFTLLFNAVSTAWIHVDVVDWSIKPFSSVSFSSNETSKLFTVSPNTLDLDLKDDSNLDQSSRNQWLNGKPQGSFFGNRLEIYARSRILSLFSQAHLGLPLPSNKFKTSLTMLENRDPN